MPKVEPNFDFTTRPSHSNLHDDRGSRGKRVSPAPVFLRAESFFNVATEIDKLGGEILDAAYGGRSLHEQSHGESFLTLMVERPKPTASNCSMSPRPRYRR